MININVPQRFYQIEHRYSSRIVKSVIDLKEVIEISLSEADGEKSVIHITRKGQHMPTDYLINPGEVSSEKYAKIVTAWTTYKLAAE